MIIEENINMEYSRVPLKKTFFCDYCQKKRLRYRYAGAHTGAPLRLYLRYFHAFVGAGPVCPPASEMTLDFANMSSKWTFSQWNHSRMLGVKVFSGGFNNKKTGFPPFFYCSSFIISNCSLSSSVGPKSWIMLSSSTLPSRSMSDKGTSMYFSMARLMGLAPKFSS